MNSLLTVHLRGYVSREETTLPLRDYLLPLNDCDLSDRLITSTIVSISRLSSRSDLLY